MYSVHVKKIVGLGVLGENIPWQYKKLEICSQLYFRNLVDK